MLFQVYLYNHYAQQVPTIEQLAEYEPPTVTVVYDRNNEVLGEIYENRRYVTKVSNAQTSTRSIFGG